VTEDAELVCKAGPVEVVIEATGDVEFGAAVSVQALEHGKHLVLMNAELDATLGPILKERADRAGVVLTNTDGDQPGVVMNLLRFVRTIGVRPVMAGNIKGLHDPYRTPETQRGFAEAHGQDTKMITSFADGTKLSMEMVVVANATGFGVGRRGMYGPRCRHVNDATGLFSLEDLLGRGPEGGLVDYVLGAEPGPGVFVLGYDPDPARAAYMKYLKMGDGPLYVFYTPYHLPHLEVPISAARAVLFGDAAITPLGAPVCEVLTVAKRDLEAGETLDGIGGFTAYGVIENADVARGEAFLPMGLADGCTLKVDVPKDRAVAFGDVSLPTGRLCDRLWKEQLDRFGS
jgi:predicted homoserine dehydrogenase-like protein